MTKEGQKISYSKETERFGIRFSSDAQVAELKKLFDRLRSEPQASPNLNGKQEQPASPQRPPLRRTRRQSV